MTKPKYLHRLAVFSLIIHLGAMPFATGAENKQTGNRYQAKLFELIEADESKYDADFAKRFTTMLAPYAKDHRNFRKRITSGAATEGNVIKESGRSYVHYGICQAHQCDTTTMNVLFDPVSKRMVAKILDRCAASWLGNPDEAEQALLDTQHQLNFPATAKSCGAAK